MAREAGFHRAAEDQIRETLNWKKVDLAGCAALGLYARVQMPGCPA